MTSWSFWSRIKSSAGIKLAAVVGLVAAFLQAAPPLEGLEAAVGPLGWLLIGGGFYLIAMMRFEWKCPVLLKPHLKGRMKTLALKDGDGCLCSLRMNCDAGGALNLKGWMWAELRQSPIKTSLRLQSFSMVTFQLTGALVNSHQHGSSMHFMSTPS